MENKVESVSQLLKILGQYRQQFGQSYRSSGFVFRGMSQTKWPLLPGVFRKLTEPKSTPPLNQALLSDRIYFAGENEIISHFKKEAGGLLPHIPQGDNFTWIQYAQHFGVPTRLLDFTLNPLIAFYFACRTQSPSDGALWILSSEPFRQWSLDDEFSTGCNPPPTREETLQSMVESLRAYCHNSNGTLKKQRPVLFIPAYIDQRMSAQSSCFIMWGEDTRSLESMTTADNQMALFPDGQQKESPDSDHRFLAKVIVSGESKHEIMRELDFLGVNEKTVFPGLDGLGRYIEQYYKENTNDIIRFYNL